MQHHETSWEIDSAAGRGDLDGIKRLVEQDISMDVWCINRALVPAAEGGHLDVVKYLVENCGQLDKWGRTALHVATSAGHADVVKYLVEKGAEVNAVDTLGQTALGEAALAGHADIVKYLVKNGAEVNAVDRFFPAALGGAAWAGHADIVKYLVKNGAEVNAVDTFGETALCMAASAGHIDIVKCLVENGADMNVVDKHGKTALHVAAERGRVGAVKFLVENGAQLDAKDEDGKAPFDLARDQTVVNYLKDKKIKEVRSLAVQFTLANPRCVRAIPYENNDTQTLTVCLYVDTGGNGIPHDVENAAKEIFRNCEFECVDLQRRPLSKIVTRLPSCRRKKEKEIFDLSRKIENNLHVFENRLNVTAVCASYKVVEAVETDIPCVTVFVLGKGKIPAKETNIQKIKECHGHLFDNADFDVVEGYYRPAYGPDPWSQMGYAFPLRGGVGIGVQGISNGAGTLGGFLQDENGECYILSCDHVLNPRKSRNNTMSSSDGPNGVMHDAKTSAGLKEFNNPTHDGPNTSRPVCLVIEQPARMDYDEMLREVKKDHDNIKAEYSDVANLSQDDQKNNDEYVEQRLELFKSENSLAEQRLQKIEKGKPRRIGEYVGGLKGNVEMNCDNETYSFYVDVAIAKLDAKEVEYVTRKKADNETNRRLYGFNKINNVAPTGDIVELDTFVEEIRPNPNKKRENLTFFKIGRKTRLTHDGHIDNWFQTLFVNYLSYPSEKRLTPAMAHATFHYCIKCKPSNISEAELFENVKDCANCGEKPKESEVYLSWMHNCFAIRQLEKPFSREGDSGSLIFDNHGRAWGLLFAGWFVSNDCAISLASPLTAALYALEKDCGKKLKLWCEEPAMKGAQERNCEEPATSGTEESKREEPAVNKTTRSKRSTCDIS